MLCPTEMTVRVLGDKWKVLILRSLLFVGTQRFGELHRGIKGVSQKVLTQQLRELEADGLVVRTVYPEVPPRVDYALTDLGRRLRPVFEALNDWGTSYVEQQLPGEPVDS